MEIKTFISKFVKAFNVGRVNSRFALLTYTKYVDVFMTLNEYSGESDLISLVDLLDEGSSNVKNTALALKEMMKMFSAESSEERKKVAIIFTNGFSVGMFFFAVTIIKRGNRRFQCYVVVFGRYQVQYGKYSLTFSSFPTCFVSILVSEIIATYDKQGEYLSILQEAMCNNYFIVECFLQSNLARFILLIYLLHQACLIYFNLEEVKTAIANLTFTPNLDSVKLSQ